MHWIVALAGLLLIIGVLWDVFEAIVLPRRVTRRFRITRAFYRITWIPWAAFASAIHTKKKREIILSIFGPLSLLALLIVWAVSLVFGFAMVHWALGSRIGPANQTHGFL